MSVLLYGCATWMLTKRKEKKKLDGNYTRMLRVVLNKSRRQRLTKEQQYGHQPPIMKTIQIRWTKHAGHSWRSKDKLISDVLLWTPSHGRAKIGRSARTYLQQLCAETGCSLEDLPGAMDNWGVRWRRVREIHASRTTWWWIDRLPCPEQPVLEIEESESKNWGVLFRESMVHCWPILFSFIFFISLSKKNMPGSTQPFAAINKSLNS